MRDEITPEEYARLLGVAMGDAREEFLNGRLLIPSALVQQCEGFFSTVLEGRTSFAWAHHPDVDPIKRAEYWAAAAKVAHQEVPKILRQIDEAARDVIHGKEQSPA